MNHPNPEISKAKPLAHTWGREALQLTASNQKIPAWLLTTGWTDGQTWKRCLKMDPVLSQFTEHTPTLSKGVFHNANLCPQCIALFVR